MATYIPKSRGEIARVALRKIENETGIKTTTVGSVARAFTEAITTEIADLYDVLEYNITQNNVSTASGRHLDNIGATYNVPRKTVSDTVEISRTSGAFYFEINTPATGPIVIPAGTKVYTSSQNFIGRQLAFSVSEDATIATGEKKVFASLSPDFGTNEVTAAPGTLVETNANTTATGLDTGVVISCTNPKAIHSQVGYESDSNYRARIIKRMAVQATGTTDAIRFALLGKRNVREVQLHNNRLGLGVVEVIVVPEDTGFSRDEMNDIRATIDMVKPSGIRAVISTPQRLTADIKAILFLSNASLRAGEQDAILATCYNLWRGYINNLLPGQSLVYNRLIDLAFNVSDKIIDVTITEFKVAGSSGIRTNYTPQPDQIVVPGNIDVTASLLS